MLPPIQLKYFLSGAAQIDTPLTLMFEGEFSPTFATRSYAYDPKSKLPPVSSIFE